MRFNKQRKNIKALNIKKPGMKSGYKRQVFSHRMNFCPNRAETFFAVKVKPCRNLICCEAGYVGVVVGETVSEKSVAGRY
jgi:hypothetical protein